jgi:hypothetical protein
VPTVLRFDGLRIAIYFNDHRPAHVHVTGGGNSAVIDLQCPHGPPRASCGASRQRLPPNSPLCAGDGKRYMATRDGYAAATAAGKRMLATTPRAVAARYDRKSDRIVVSLNTGFEVSFSPRETQGLENARAEQLAMIEITPPGFGLHWPKLDVDLYVPAVIEGILGSRRWMAARLGAAGGRSRSEVKAAASRENGKLGGRPPKKVRQPYSVSSSTRRRKKRAPRAAGRAHAR